MTTPLHPSVASTLAAYGATSQGIRRAHADTRPAPAPGRAAWTRQQREDTLAATLAPGATRPLGSGDRAVDEEPDPHLLCFESDLERIRYSAAFRRLAGKCQVFVSPRNDMLRTRLTHAIEVAQVATHVAAIAGLCVPLAEAIAYGHDCGHGPGGHSAEEAFSPYLAEGFDHAIWGADVVLPPLNLCAQTLDGIRSHSWKLDAPTTLEGEVVSWADRVAYVVADWEDAVRAGIVRPDTLPGIVTAKAGHSSAEQLRFFTQALVTCTADTGQVGMYQGAAEVLDAFRRNNFERIYMRPGSLDQAERTIKVLRALVDYHVDAPYRIPEVPAAGEPLESGSDAAARAAVGYIASMTDRYAFTMAEKILGWQTPDLPRTL